MAGSGGMRAGKAGADIARSKLLQSREVVQSVLGRNHGGANKLNLSE